jgi:hypothetical protein
MAEHRFEVGDALWEQWTEALPASTTPDERLAELLRADLDDRIDRREGPRGIPALNTETQTAPIDPTGIEDEEDDGGGDGDGGERA